LRQQAVGDIVVGRAEALRLTAGRHVERAEGEIDKGEEAVMPAMERPARDQISQPAVRPAHVGMEQQRIQ